MGRLGRAFTPNVVGVILLLIALTLIPYLLPRLIGVSPARPGGEGAVFAVSLSLIFSSRSWRADFEASSRPPPSCWAFWPAVWVLGLGRLDLTPVREASWLSLPEGLWQGMPRFSPSAVLSSVLAYLAVAVNAVGSMHGVAGVLGIQGSPSVWTGTRTHRLGRRGGIRSGRRGDGGLLD